MCCDSNINVMTIGSWSDVLSGSCMTQACSAELLNDVKR